MVIGYLIIRFRLNFLKLKILNWFSFILFCFKILLLWIKEKYKWYLFFEFMYGFFGGDNCCDGSFFWIIWWRCRIFFFCFCMVFNCRRNFSCFCLNKLFFFFVVFSRDRFDLDMVDNLDFFLGNVGLFFFVDEDIVVLFKLVVLFVVVEFGLGW